MFSVYQHWDPLKTCVVGRSYITPHVVPFRHRYFWDGGIHCITLDLDREGKMHDYFPDRQ